MCTRWGKPRCIVAEMTKEKRNERKKKKTRNQRHGHDGGGKRNRNRGGHEEGLAHDLLEREHARSVACTRSRRNRFSDMISSRPIARLRSMQQRTGPIRRPGQCKARLDQSADQINARASQTNT
jgi:hypothetical protein